MTGSGPSTLGSFEPSQGVKDHLLVPPGCSRAGERCATPAQWQPVGRAFHRVAVRGAPSGYHTATSHQRAHATVVRLMAPFDDSQRCLNIRLCPERGGCTIFALCEIHFDVVDCAPGAVRRASGYATPAKCFQRAG